MTFPKSNILLAGGVHLAVRLRKGVSRPAGLAPVVLAVLDGVHEALAAVSGQAAALIAMSAVWKARTVSG